MDSALNIAPLTQEKALRSVWDQGIFKVYFSAIFVANDFDLI
jgi:hypothetical protein